jgi:hypothetical protein
MAIPVHLNITTLPTTSKYSSNLYHFMENLQIISRAVDFQLNICYLLISVMNGRVAGLKLTGLHASSGTWTNWAASKAFKKY